MTLRWECKVYGKTAADLINQAMTRWLEFAEGLSLDVTEALAIDAEPRVVHGGGEVVEYEGYARLRFTVAS